MPNLLETMDCFRGNLPPVPEKPRPILKEESLFKKLLQAQAACKGENVEVYQLSQVLSQLCEEFKKEAGKEEPTDKGKPIETPPTPPRDNSLPSLPSSLSKDPSPGKPLNLDPKVRLQRTKLGSVAGVLKPSRLPDPASKNKGQQSQHLESNDFLNALSNEVDNSADSGIVANINSSKGESEVNKSATQKRKNTDDSHQGSTPKKPKLGCFIEGVTVKHGSNASVTFFCKVAANKGGAHRTQSLSDEDEEGASEWRGRHT